MNWIEFQSAGEKFTQEEIDDLTIEVFNQYDAAYDKISIDLQRQYSKLLTGVKPEDYYNEMMKFNRLTKLQGEVGKSYLEYSKKARDIIENIMFVGFSNNFYRQQYMASWMSSFDIGILPYKLAEFTVYGTIDNWKRMTSRIEKIYGDVSRYKAQSGTVTQLLTKNAKNELNAIRNHITQGLLQGKSYPKMMDGIKDIIGRQLKKDDKYTVTGAKYNSMRVIRTESHRTMSAGHYASSKYLDSVGLDIKRKIIAVLDNRTRSQSATMDGQTVGIDDPFKYPNGATSYYPGNSGVAKYDINDRERVIDIINKGDPYIRVGRNPKTGENETFNFKGFEEWAKEKGLRRNKYGELLFPGKQ